MSNNSFQTLLVCFGDSLTAGYVVGRPGGIPGPDQPYGKFLKKWLGHKGEVVITGICGELTEGMMKRFQRDAVALTPKFVVILGGTNDLGWGLEPVVIHQHLLVMYQQAKDAGIQPVSVTVPSLCEPPAEVDLVSELDSIPSWIQTHIDQRLILNKMIQESSAQLHIPCVDLFAGTSVEPFQVLASHYSCDGLHLNKAGYQHFAELVWQEVFASHYSRESLG
jgi:lysophospholipase L1-like esterase